MQSGADVWICGRCRSINSAGSGRCYKCFVPRTISEARPEDLPLHRTDAPLIVGAFRSTRARAFLLTVTTVVFIVVTSVEIAIVYLANDAWLAGEQSRSDSLRAVALPGLAGLTAGAAVVAMLAYAWWVHRAIQNLPALGLGYVRVSPGWAVIEALIPGVNLVAIIAHLARIAQKLEIMSTTFPLMGLAGLLMFAPAGAAIWVLRAERVFGTGADFFRSLSITIAVLFALAALGLVLLLFVVWEIEATFRERAATAEGRPVGPGG